MRLTMYWEEGWKHEQRMDAMRMQASFSRSMKAKGTRCRRTLLPEHDKWAAEAFLDRLAASILGRVIDGESF